MDRFFLSHRKNISAAYIWINGGSCLDDLEKKGINQILCSLLTRGCNSFDNFEISKIIDDNGAELYYETLEDGIYIGIKSLNEYFVNIYPLLELFIKESTLPEREFLKCKNEQINFILKSKENLFLKTFDNWRKIVYKNHPYSYDSCGYIESIKNITYEDITKEYEKFSHRSMFLVSNYKSSNLIDIKKQFICKNNTNKFTKKFICIDKKQRFIETHLSTNQIVMMLGNQTCSHNNDDFLALKILESYLAFGMSSVLFKWFREKNGLTYDSGIMHPVRIDNAPFLIYLSVSSDKALEAFQLLRIIWNELLKKIITKEELNLAKIKLKNSILQSNQCIEEIILRKAQLVAYKMDYNFDSNSLNKIKNINSEEIIRVTNKYLKNPFLSILGDPKVCKEIKKYWEDEF